MKIGSRKLGWGAIILIAFAGLLALGAAWYLISPLFIDRAVDEAFPSTAPEMDEVFFAEATAAMDEAMAEDDTMMTEEMPEGDMSSMKILAQGEFYDLAHHGMGTATIYELEDGSRVLRFENFEVLNGPDLHVWLVGDDPVQDTIGIEPEIYTDLGQLKGNIGDQNYTIPDDLDLSLYKSVVIWCVPFRVPFNAAALTAL